MSESQQASSDADVIDGVAIIGMAGRFPGADDPEALWRNLCAGFDSVTTFSEDALRAAGVSEKDLANLHYIRRWGAISSADCFDAEFFGLTRRDAELIDPQQRLFLQSAWAALEDAGCIRDRHRLRVGVYGGVGFTHYFAQHLASQLHDLSPASFYRLLFGNDKDFANTRVAHALDLRGPAITLQTACSTSLVAVCTAALHLLTQQCDVALAGGSSVRLPLTAGYLYEEGGTASADGICRTFDAAASGTVFGSGVGVVVLKRLADALRDGDHIYAVIRGFALNNDGAGKAGFAAPSEAGQAEVISQALAMADVSAASIGYVEAHGTATPLGDPIEVAALTRAFRGCGGTGNAYCALGSVKTNVGHLDVAAGVTGLIKAALAIERDQIPASLHFQSPNPHIDFARSPFFVNTALRPFPSLGGPRRAGVSAFGMGGTNAHVVLEQAPVPPPLTDTALLPRPVLLPLSAKDAAALERNTHALVAWLRTHPSAALADVAHTLQTGREAFSHRRFVVCNTVQEAVVQLPRAAAAIATPSVGVTLRDAAATEAARQGWQRLGISEQFSGSATQVTVDVDPTRSGDVEWQQAIGRLWQAGVNVDWTRLKAGTNHRRLPLPTYSFARERYVQSPPDKSTNHALHTLDWCPTDSSVPLLSASAVMWITEPGQLQRLLLPEDRRPILRVFRPTEDGLETLAMALAELQLLLRAENSRQVVWITQGAQYAQPADRPVPTLAALWGLARSFVREHPPFQLSLLDVDTVDLSSPVPDLRAAGVAQAALRGGVMRLPQLRKIEALSPATRTVNGTVLITGGLGVLGLRLAEHVVRQHGVRALILIARHPPSELQKPRIAALHKAGVDLEIAVLDVADRAALARVIQTPRPLPIQTVIHAAGVVDDGIVANLTKERLQATCSGKAQGATWLDELTRDVPLQNFVLFSSLSGLGMPGQAAYAAANTFLDALAVGRQARGLPGLSIGWGPWAGDGMAALAKNPRAIGPALAPEDGLRLFESALGQSGPLLYVAEESIAATLLHREPSPPEGKATGAGSVRSARSEAKPLRGSLEASEILALVRETVAHLLRINPASLSMSRSLPALGVDSLMGVELRSILSSRIGRSVPGSLLLEQPDIRAIAAALSALTAPVSVASKEHPASQAGITRLHPASPFPSLFLVGGAVGGDELYLRDLATVLGPLFPCYALHYPGLTEQEQPMDDVAALAELFVQRLLAFQPHGPFALAGHSLGGMIAFEMAHKLTQRGHTVVELILLDAPLFSDEERYDGEHAVLWLSGSLSQYIDRIKERGWLTPKLAEVLSHGTQQAGWPLLERLWKANATAMTRYRPRGAYHGEVSFITPLSERDGLARCLGAWRTACPALKVLRTTGNHVSMVRLPHAEKTGRLIRSLFIAPESDETQSVS